MRFICIFIRSKDLLPPTEFGRGPIRDTYEEAESDGKTFVGRCGRSSGDGGVPFPLDWDPTVSYSYRVISTA